MSSADPFLTISQLQQQLSLSTDNETVGPALDFLEVLACSRPTRLYVHFQSIKSEMEATIEGLDEQALLLLLKETLAFMSVEELKSVPILMIKKLGTRVPVSYLNYLKGKNLLDSLPIEVRRQAWLSNRDAFLEAIKTACSTAFEQIKEKGRADVTNIDVIVSSIGQSEILFSILPTTVDAWLPFKGPKMEKKREHICISLGEFDSLCFGRYGGKISEDCRFW